MSTRRIALKPTSAVAPCPKCGNATSFVIRSEQCAEDCCEVWATCGACGHDPTINNPGHRMEDVWGGCHDENALAAVSIWTDVIHEQAAAA